MRSIGALTPALVAFSFSACLVALTGLGGCSSTSASPPMATSPPSSGDASTAPASSSGVMAGADAGGGADTATDAVAEAGTAALCPSGTTLTADQRTCPGAALTAPASLTSALATAAPGDVVSLGGLAEDSAPCLAVVTCTPNDAPSMLFSDDPESPTSDGVLYADVIGAPGGPARSRIYVYHANGDAQVRKFPVVVLNQNAADATVTIVRRGVGGPSQSYVSIGKDVLAAWLTPLATPVTVTVPAGQRVLLDADLDGRQAATNELVHAIYDVEASAPLKVSVVSVLAGEDAASVTAGLPLLPNDGAHARGTFPNADILVVGAAQPDSGVRRLRFGGNVVDQDLAGVDATTGAKLTLLGNYGVFYRVALGFASPTPAAIAPRGGGWGGVASLSSVDPLPSASEQLDSQTSAIALGPVGTTEFSFMSGGGSNLAVDLLIASP